LTSVWICADYQAVLDEKYFQSVRWQYMILDEAQAIKSSSSARWKSLLTLNCRNRLLLTGTPIQNSMQGELTVSRKGFS
jgi:DNA helicase INO80